VLLKAGLFGIKVKIAIKEKIIPDLMVYTLWPSPIWFYADISPRLGSNEIWLLPFYNTLFQTSFAHKDKHRPRKHADLYA
jgi:hypothetical protein